MIKNLTKTLALTLAAIGTASALPFSFIYNGNSWGTMDLTVSNASTVQVSFTAHAVTGVSDFQVTGFAFELATGLNLSIIDANNSDGLEWINLTNMNAIPTSANTGIHKDIWDIGITEGKATGFNPPGIHPGSSDLFFLSGFSGLTDDASIASNITLEGIRIQAIGGTNVTSLFLTGSPTETPAVPEPSTVALLGLGLAGIALVARRKSK